jgi:methionine synthase II (cobalamin-independent)
VGSLPIDNHADAVRLMAEYTPEIPVWIQLPCYPAEGMIDQFLPGMPGLAHQDGRTFIRVDDDAFHNEMLLFYEEYLNLTEGKAPFADSRFALTMDIAPGFFEFIKYLDGLKIQPAAVKGQITGPFTFSTSVKDQDGRAIFYHPDLRDVLVKCIAAKARWQVSQLRKYGIPILIFLDEPGLAGFGTSAFISVSREDIEASLGEVISAIHLQGGLAGVHVCANTDWSIVLESPVDVVSFDAYSFFDKFILYEKEVKKFIERGGILAWGIVPTGNTRWVDQESADSLYDRWKDQLKQVAALGFDPGQIVAQSLITPSCGTGSLPVEHAIKVIQMTQEISLKIRRNFIL